MKQSLIVSAAIALAGGALLTNQINAKTAGAGDVLDAAPTVERGGPTLLTTTLFASGLVRPIFATHAPDDFERVFIIEKQGIIRIVKNGSLLPTPFLDIDSLVGGGTTTNSEQGLLGLAFHPNYQSNGLFYVSYTNNSGVSTIAEYSVSGNADVANSGSADVILLASQPFTNHNGGWIGFGPNDGYLYVSLGDGGSFCDPSQRAQNLNDVLGKMHRIDVDGDDFPADANRDYAIPPSNPLAGGGGRPEIWAYGVRNVWRPSFDRETGDLYMADVGQNNWEEVNIQAAGVTSLLNYGWDCMEGSFCSSAAPSSCGAAGCVCNAPGLVNPTYQYQRVGGNCSITGGYVYRGCAIPDLQGTYFFADYCSNQISSFRWTAGGGVTGLQSRTAELAPGGGFFLTSITSFGEDAFGEIYICNQNLGQVFKIVPRTFVGPDCNGNSRNDACDILAGSSADANSNGVPDECEIPPCPADLDGDGSVGASDLANLLGSWGGSGAADLDNSGEVSAGDLALLLGSWGPCPM